MSFTRPTLSDIINRMRNDIVSRVTSSDILRRSNAEVYARALSGAVHGLYGYIDWLSRQLIYDTAEGYMLERWAAIWGITRKPASYASGSVTFTGLDGATVPAGSLIIAYDSQVYETVADAVIAAGIATAVVYAKVAGVAGNRTAGQTLSLQAAIAGINSSVLAGVLAGGAAIESDDSLRSRFLARIKSPPLGGSKSDYINWTMAVSGVTRAWVYPLEGGSAGAVTVRFMMDGTYVDGIPQAADVTAVAAYIDPLRPVTAAVTVVAPVAVPLNFSISGLNPATLAVKAAVTQQLTDLITREASPGGTLYLSHINEAISLASGEVDHVLVLPAANVVSATGYISTMGTITWL